MWLIVDSPVHVPIRTGAEYCMMTDFRACKESVLGHRKSWKVVANCKLAFKSLGPIHFYHGQADRTIERACSSIVKVRPQDCAGGSSLTAGRDSVMPDDCVLFIFLQQPDFITWYQNRNKIMPGPVSFRL